MSIGENIRKRRLELGMSQDELAELSGYTSRSAITKIETGVNDITQSKIVAIAKALKTTPSALMDETNTNIQLPKKEPVTYINILSSFCSCGFGDYADDHIDGVISVPSSMLPKGKHTYIAQYANGDSMKDADIEDGDILIFVLQSTIESGQIGAFCYQEKSYCKKYKVVNNQMWLMPCNDQYEPIVIENMDEFRVVGVYCAKISRVRQ